MKNKIFIMGAFLFVFQIVSAQQSYGEQFVIQTGSGGFATGAVNGQNGWQATNPDGEDNTGFIIVDDGPEASTRGGEIYMPHNPDFVPSVGVPEFECRSVSLESLGVTTSAVTIFAFFIDADDDDQTEGSNYTLKFEDINGILVSKVVFVSNGTIQVANDFELGLTDTGFTWTEEEWIRISIDYDFVGGNMKYIMNDVIIYEVSLLQGGGTSLEHFVIQHDNQPGSEAFFDDLTVVATGTLDVKEIKYKQMFSVFPNPANNIVFVKGQEDTGIAEVSVRDIEGRVVKLQKANSNNASQIEIAGLAGGMYIVTALFDDGTTATEKILKN